MNDGVLNQDSSFSRRWRHRCVLIWEQRFGADSLHFSASGPLSRSHQHLWATMPGEETFPHLKGSKARFPHYSRLATNQANSFEPDLQFSQIHRERKDFTDFQAGSGKGRPWDFSRRHGIWDWGGRLRAPLLKFQCRRKEQPSQPIWKWSRAQHHMINRWEDRRRDCFGVRNRHWH